MVDNWTGLIGRKMCKFTKCSQQKSFSRTSDIKAQFQNMYINPLDADCSLSGTAHLVDVAQWINSVFKGHWINFIKYHTFFAVIWNVIINSTFWAEPQEGGGIAQAWITDPKVYYGIVMPQKWCSGQRGQWWVPGTILLKFVWFLLIVLARFCWLITWEDLAFRQGSVSFSRFHKKNIKHLRNH